MARRALNDADVTLKASELAALTTEANRAAAIAGDPIGAMEASDAADSLQQSEDDANALALQALMEIDVAGETRWQIIRVMPADKAGYLCELTGPELTLESIAKRCGPGKYRIRGIDSKGKYAGMRTIQVAEQPSPPTPTAPPTSTADFLALMREEREREKIERSQKNEDYLKWAAILAPVIGPIMANLVGNKGPTLAEISTTLKNMRELSGAAGERSEIDKLKDMVSLVRELSEDKTPQPVGKSPWDLVSDAIHALPATLSAVAQNRAIAPAAIAQQPPAKIAAPAPQSIPQPMPPQTNQAGVASAPQAANGGHPMMQLLMWFRGQLPSLINKASLNRNPELAADVLIEEAPDNTDPQMLLDLLSRPDWWTFFTQVSPDVKPYEGWFTSLRAALIENLNDVIAEALDGAQVPPASAPQSTPAPIERVTPVNPFQPSHDDT